MYEYLVPHIILCNENNPLCDTTVKEKYSSRESQLSFELITIDASAKTMEVKQIFWNKGSQLMNGEIKTIHL